MEHLRELTNTLSNGTTRSPMPSPSSRLGDCNLATATPILSQEQVKLYTDFKFGGYIYMANPNKSPLKILKKRERGRIPGLPNFLGTCYYLRNG